MEEEQKKFKESPYAPAPDEPTQEAIDGIRFDFNYGLRIRTPDAGDKWRIVFRDIDTDVTMYDSEIGTHMFIMSSKKYFVRFHIQVFHIGESEPAFEHVYDPEGKDILIQLPVPTIGDTLGWLPYVEKFRVRNKCHVIAVLNEMFIPLFEKTYPEITFITKEQVSNYKPYATYYVGLYFKGDTDYQPCDFKLVGLHRTAGYILGVDPTEVPPRFDLSAPRKIAEPYVCIAVQSSAQCKYWNNPWGWLDVIKFLKQSGYRVLCIDKSPVYGGGLFFNSMPNGCEDFTGAFPLQERIDLLKDADFFVGLGSGLSWLAWGCGVPVVLISGFSHPSTEFYTPYRVINYQACNSCWNDMHFDFDHHDFLWCPRHKNTDRQFECTRLITSNQVINTIKRIPAFQKHMEELGR